MPYRERTYQFKPIDFVDCGTLQNPNNGHVSLIDGTTLEANATYSCNSGFQLIGDNRRQCLANGVWSGGEPICTKTGMCQ